MEEANELIERLKSGGHFPLLTSCCPSWVLYVEKYFPEFIPNLSSCKSPQQMFSPIIKTYYANREKLDPSKIVNLSIMPCTSKKYEAKRPEMNSSGHRDTDVVLTVRELARLLKRRKIDPNTLSDQKYDPALGVSTGAGILFASSGGVMEAALRTAVETITGEKLGRLDFDVIRGTEGLRCAEIDIEGKKVRVAVAHEIRNAKSLLEEIKAKKADYHFIEVMACPNGCIGGGGQPIPSTPEIRRERIKGVLSRDKGMPIRKSHENPIIKKLYREFLSRPGSEIAEDLLHTTYTNRKP